MWGALVTEFGVEGIVEGVFFLGRGGLEVTCMCGFDVPKLNCKQLHHNDKAPSPKSYMKYVKPWKIFRGP